MDLQSKMQKQNRHHDLIRLFNAAGEYRTKRASLPRQAQHKRFRFQIIACPLRNAMQKLLKNGLITVLEILHVRKVILVEPEEILFFFLGKYTCGAIYDRGRGTPVDRNLHDLKLDAVGPQKSVCVFSPVGSHAICIHGICSRKRAL